MNKEMTPIRYIYIFTIFSLIGGNVEKRFPYPEDIYNDSKKQEFTKQTKREPKGNRPRTEEPLICDVIIVGGSAAALGAALASANASHDHVICLTEPTDWLGGQLTTAAVSAVDFGDYNRNWWFQSQRFESMMSSVGDGNPGQCWVSTKCFLPTDMLNKWIMPSVKTLPNLKIFYNTVPIFVSTQNRVITAIKAVQRIPKQTPYLWNRTLSQSIKDWYSKEKSQIFDKVILTFVGPRGKAPVVIEATEYGEILVLANASYSVGVEAPTEDSQTTIENCGQCTTFPLYMGSSVEPAPKQNIPNPGGRFSMQNFTWDKIWTYRRSMAMPHSTGESFQLGDISNQNWGGGNDFCGSTIFLSHDVSDKQKISWMGGVNISALASAEQRAYGWFHYYKVKAEIERSQHLYLDYEALETQTGIPKIPYLRDSRRSFGIGGFRLMKSDMDKPASDNPVSKSSSFNKFDHFVNDPSGTNQNLLQGPQPLPPSKFSTRFKDSIGLGNYFYADVHGVENCPWPPYIYNKTILPYHIPFRSLTNMDYDNLLVAGKVLAQTFHAQAATRMHPSDFMTGEAAGVAAVMMQQMKLTTSQMYQKVSVLQEQLEKFMPIFWDKPRTVNVKYQTTLQLIDVTKVKAGPFNPDKHLDIDN